MKSKNNVSGGCNYVTMIVIFCFLPLYSLWAQNQKRDQSQIYLNIETTLGNINRLLGSGCKMEFNEELIITFYENGLPFREDRVYLDALNPHKVHFITEEEGVAMDCLEFKGLSREHMRRYGEGCISREFFKDKNIIFYSRILFPAKNADNAILLQAELVKLIRYGHELTIK